MFSNHYASLNSDIDSGVQSMGSGSMEHWLLESCDGVATLRQLILHICWKQVVLETHMVLQHTYANHVDHAGRELRCYDSVPTSQIVYKAGGVFCNTRA